MATVDKCNGVINPDGSDMPRNPNLMEVSKNYKINDSLSNILSRNKSNYVKSKIIL